MASYVAALAVLMIFLDAMFGSAVPAIMEAAVLAAIVTGAIITYRIFTQRFPHIEQRLDRLEQALDQMSRQKSENE